jgi:hypothetical protein
MKAKMTVVKSPRLDAEEAKENGKTEAPLPLNELLDLINRKGTVQEREQVVIENLRRQGLIK